MFLAFHDDMREAVRRVRRNPRLTLLAVGILALGIGAASAVLTMAHTVMYAAPPFHDADRIVSLQGRIRGRTTGMSNLDLQDYRRDPALLRAAALTAYSEFSWTGQSLPGFDGAEVLRGQSVTDEFFRVFDAPMALGRGFTVDEGRPGSDVVVISYSLWQRRLGARPDVLGHTLTLDGRPHAIVGVTGPRFLTYESYEVLVWTILQPSTRRRAHQYDCYARLAAGVSIDQAQRRLDEVSARLARAYPDSNSEFAVSVAPLLAELREQARPAFLALVAAVVCLLLIAIANVASLLLARATVEAREMAIRAALGAGRLRLFRMMIGQGALLALLAAAGGALIGAWLLDAARALMPASLQLGWAFTIDGRVFIAAFVVSAIAGLGAGVAPAFESFRFSMGGLRPSFHRSRVLQAIVAAEVALAVFLLVGAGLLGKSFAALVARPLGYETENLLGVRVRLQGDRYRTIEQRGAYWSHLLERAGSLPGVARAGSVSDLPMGRQYISDTFDTGSGAPAAGPRPRAHVLAASPGYFSTLGIPAVQGRGFTDDDGHGSEPVAIVNDLLAERFWPGQTAIGKMIGSGGDWRRVVGVVRRIRHDGPQDEYENEIYLPYRQFSRSTMFLVVRGNLPAESLVASIRGALTSIDPDVPAFEIRTLGQAFAREIAQPRLPVVTMIAVATMALILTGLGVFGVVAYWVSQRTTELGVRSALGARPEQLRALVLGQGGRLMAVGLTAGLAGALVTMRVVRSLLYGMSERDPSVYIGAIVTVAVITVVACWLPAARAARIDPATALREQ